MSSAPRPRARTLRTPASVTSRWADIWAGLRPSRASLRMSSSSSRVAGDMPVETVRSAVPSRKLVIPFQPQHAVHVQGPLVRVPEVVVRDHAGPGEAQSLRGRVAEEPLVFQDELPYFVALFPFLSRRHASLSLRRRWVQSVQYSAPP